VLVPDDLRRTIGTWAGARGQEWLASLPRLVDEVAERWSLTIGEPYQPSGYTSLALRVTRDGEPYVLKVRIPDEWSAGETEALRHYAGRAAVALVDEDAERDALLLERCDPGTPLLTEPDDVAAETVAALLRELWAPPPEGHGLRALRDHRVPEWVRTLRGARHVPERLRDEALDVLAWLDAEPADEVVLHCDLHPGNVLRAARRPWLVIDPKGAVGDPARDLAPVIRDRPWGGVVPRRFAIVCAATGLDPARVRGWALAQSVEGAEESYGNGDTAGGDEFLAAAEAVRALVVP
jgi:streptomycin 6-kinase